MRLHLIDLLGLGPSPCLLPSALAHHVETGRAHQKYIVTRTRVSRSKSPDQQTHFCVVLAPAIYFWWTRGESNSRPQRLHLEGITTISLLYDTPIYVSTRPVLPPRFENVETSKKAKEILPPQQSPQWQNYSLDSYHLPNKWATMPMATNTARAPMAAQGMFSNSFIVHPDDRWATWYHNTQL